MGSQAVRPDAGLGSDGRKPAGFMYKFVANKIRARAANRAPGVKGRMGVRFEFDAENKILLGRFEGRFSDESLGEMYESIRRYSVATDARAGILDFSLTTEFAVSSDTIRNLARQEPAMPDAVNRPRVLVAPATHLFGIARMFQLVGEHKRPRLTVVRTLDEAFAALGLQSPHFEPLAL
jgi:hypothetical protein